MEKSIYTREYACMLRLLRAVRKDAGMTQLDVSEKIEETQSYVSKVERGELRLDVVQLRTLCKVLGVTLADFVQRLERELAKRR